MRRGSSTVRSPRPHGLFTVLVALCGIIGCVNVKAQNIVSRPPSFQAAGSQSFENQILDRLTQTGQLQPDDLPNLARLVFLESIAMNVDVTTDLTGTTIGNGLAAEITALSGASELFYESVASAPPDLPSIARSLEVYESVGLSYGGVDATLGAFPGWSIQAADHLRHVARLMAQIAPMMQELDSNLPATIPIPPNSSYPLDSLQRKTRSLASELVQMIINMSKLSEKVAGQPDRRNDLVGLLEHVQGFEHQLVLRPSNVELEASVHALRKRFWRVEATIVQLGWPAELRSGWRTLRERMNAVSDDFGMPRVINPGTPVSPVAQSDSVTSKGSIARIYRGKLAGR